MLAIDKFHKCLLIFLQDELEAAVSARSRRNKHEESNTYSDDFEDDGMLYSIWYGVI